ncbi:acyltransferase family protein [soil metagenome]
MTTAYADRPAAEAQRTAEGAHNAKPRTPYWDNARFVAIALVVLGHGTLKLISKSDPAYSLYLFIYLFHSPVFVAVSGYFAKAGPPKLSDIKKLLSMVVVPYLIFETVWSGIHWAMSGTLKLDYTTPWWTLWFLIALAIWRVTLPYLAMLRFPLLISIAVAVAAGYIANIDNGLSLARAVGLLPFFVFGWKLKEWKLGERWLELPAKTVWLWRSGAIILFAAVAVITVSGIGAWRTLLVRRFLLYDEQYSSFGYDQWWAGALRLGFLALGMVLCLAFLILVPRRRTWFSRAGQATMYIYLLHSFVLYPIRQSGALDGPESALVLGGVVALCLVLPFVLGSPIVRRVFRPVIEPDLDWLWRRKARRAT